MKKILTLLIAAIPLGAMAVVYAAQPSAAAEPGTCFELIAGQGGEKIVPCSKLKESYGGMSQYLTGDSLNKINSMDPSKCYKVVSETNTSTFDTSLQVTEIPCSDNSVNPDSGSSGASGAGTGCSILPFASCDGSGGSDDINKLLVLVLQILMAGVGIVAVGALVFAGILYTSAGDNAQQVSQAKGIITNTVIGVVVFGLMMLGLNFLIPGGVIQ